MRYFRHIDIYVEILDSLSIHYLLILKVIKGNIYNVCINTVETIISDIMHLLFTVNIHKLLFVLLSCKVKNYVYNLITSFILITRSTGLPWSVSLKIGNTSVFVVLQPSSNPKADYTIVLRYICPVPMEILLSLPFFS